MICKLLSCTDYIHKKMYVSNSDKEHMMLPGKIQRYLGFGEIRRKVQSYG